MSYQLEPTPEMGAWQTEAHETWMVLRGPDLRTSPSGRFSFPADQAKQVLAAIEQVAMHHLVADWLSSGGEFLQEVYQRAMLSKRGRLVLNPAGLSRNAEGRNVPYIEIPYVDLQRLPIILREWLQLAAKQSTTPNAGESETQAGFADPTETCTAGPVGTMSTNAMGDWQVDIGPSYFILRGPGLRAAPDMALSFPVADVKKVLAALNKVRNHPAVRTWLAGGGSFGKRINVQPHSAFGLLTLSRQETRRSITPTAAARVPFADLRELLRLLNAWHSHYNQPAARPIQKGAKRRNTSPTPSCSRRNCDHTVYDPLSKLCKIHYGQEPVGVRFVSGGGFESNRRRH